MEQLIIVAKYKHPEDLDISFEYILVTELLSLINILDTRDKRAFFFFDVKDILTMIQSF